MKPIAHIYTDFNEKFGAPRQSGLVKEAKGKIVFEAKYSVADAVRGLEEFSHIWVLWQFSESVREGWRPTVRPPLLGGNKRIGVFATRSPFRPNNIGLSSLRLEGVDTEDKKGVTLYVSGCDMLSGTPVYDIKPYLPYTDCHSDATGGFTEGLKDRRLEVSCPEELVAKISEEKREAVMKVISQDPRPSYQSDPERIYHLSFAEYEIDFHIEHGKAEIVDVKCLDSI